VEYSQTVETELGLVAGFVDGDVSTYLGIPYAAPPVGELRWQPPQPAEAWDGVYEALEFGPASPQPEFFDLGGVEMSEDCLYLNVWTSEPEAGADLPVIVWIYGGAYAQGASSQPEYDGADMAAEGVVVVSMNYRLGALGFLTQEDLNAEAGHAGNYGLMDQIASLEWVQTNIEGFGGDPDNVTIVGVSAGASSVTWLLSSPLSEGLFDRAISESGTALGDYYALGGVDSTWSGAVAEASALEDVLGVTGIGELREVGAEDIVAATEELGIHFGPVMDGYVITDSPRDALLNIHDGVDLLIGTTKDDGWGFDDPPRTVDAYEQRMIDKFGDATSRVLARYPASTPEEALAMDNLVLTTAEFTEPARYTADAVAAQGANVYRYYFTYTPPTFQGELFGAYHSAEVAYVFGNMAPDEGEWGEGDQALSDVMQRYWVNFAATGDPNDDGLAQWPAYTAAAQDMLVIDGVGNDTILSGGINNEDADFFQSIAPVVSPDYPGASSASAILASYA